MSRLDGHLFQWTWTHGSTPQAFSVLAQPPLVIGRHLACLDTSQTLPRWCREHSNGRHHGRGALRRPSTWPYSTLPPSCSEWQRAKAQIQESITRNVTHYLTEVNDFSRHLFCGTKSWRFEALKRSEEYFLTLKTGRAARCCYTVLLDGCFCGFCSGDFSRILGDVEHHNILQSSQRAAKSDSRQSSEPLRSDPQRLNGGAAEKRTSALF